MISVIIPVYNVKEYLNRCVESVVNQTYGNMEIILVDDASYDGSEALCDLWAENDRRIKTVHLKENKGHGGARNIGVLMCEGEFLTFLDSDDWWEPDFLEKLHTAAEQYNSDMVICDIYYEYHGKAAHTEISEIRMQNGKVYNAVQNKNIINTARTFLWGKLYRTEFYRSLTVKQPPLGFDDLAVVPYIVSKAQGIVRYKAPLYHYLRYREGNTVDNFDNLYGICDALVYLFNYFAADGTYDFYYAELRKLAFSQVRFAVRKLGAEKREQYHDLICRLTDFMDDKFPGWFNPYQKQYAIVGNAGQAETVRLIMFDDGQLHMVNADDSMEIYDYVFRNVPSAASQSERWDIADWLFSRLCEGQELNGMEQRGRGNGQRKADSDFRNG